jgi:hypothetical protein
MESHLVESCSIFEVFPRNAKFPTFCGAASSETRNGGGRAPSSKRSRKGNKKKTAAHKFLLKLLHELPTYIKSEWATAKELRDRLVDGGVHDSVTEADICDVLTRLDKGVAIICRAYDENNTKYYRHHSFDGTNTTPSNKYHEGLQRNVPSIEKDYFASNDSFHDDLMVIKAYACTGTISESLLKPCRRWYGTKYTDIMYLSMQDALSEQRASV